jgi:osmotically-inducible protein OsmY
MKAKVKGPRYFRKSDEEIAKAIADQFRWHTQVPEDLIKVTVEHGWVVLRGTVEWEFQKRAAERVVKRLTLVRGITNNITLKGKAHEAAGRLAA